MSKLCQVAQLSSLSQALHLQVDSLKKGYDGFDKDGGTINQTSMMMILKSMGVEVNKSDMDNYAAEVDEEETGKFTFMMFCQVHFR